MGARRLQLMELKWLVGEIVLHNARKNLAAVCTAD